MEFPPPRSPAEHDLLTRIRAEIDALETCDWTLAADDVGMFLEARERASGVHVPLARFTGQSTSEEQQLIARAPFAIAFLVILLGRAAGEIRALRNGAPAPVPKNYAAQCAIACGKPAFRAFLTERYQLVPGADEETAASLVRHLVGVKSRADINTDADAAARWRALDEEFRGWQG